MFEWNLIYSFKKFEIKFKKQKKNKLLINSQLNIN